MDVSHTKRLLLFFSLPLAFIAVFLSSSPVKAMMISPYFNIKVAVQCVGGDTAFSFHYRAYSASNPVTYDSQDFQIQTVSGGGSHPPISPAVGNDTRILLTEDAISGWQNSSVTCHSDNPLVTTASVDGGVLIYAFPYSSITCTFTNTKQDEKPNPVIIIPGILGSAEKDGVWIIDPIFHTYDDLIGTLEANGYTEGKDLFTLPYDWRESNELTAEVLKLKIADVKKICGCDKVDLVAHSMGGLVARQYIQSDYYRNDVDKLIFLGTPHLGAPMAYLPWEGAEMPGGVVDFGIKTLLWWDAKKLGLSLFDYIHQDVLSLEELLPVYDYLTLKNTGVVENYPNGYPPNSFLENLSNNVGRLLDSSIKITNVVGNEGSSTVTSIIVASSTSSGLWEYGHPDTLNYGIGDGTVPLDSAEFINKDINIFNSEHINLPSVSESLVFKKLTGKDTQQTVNNGLNLDVLFLIKMFSPADFQVVAPDGKRIGKDFATDQEMNEIDGAFYSGFQTDDEYVTIPNPSDGEYKVVTQGTGDGGVYTIATGYITDSGSAESDFQGQTLPGMINTINVNVSSASTVPLTTTPEDNVPPVITNTSPTAKDYLRSDKFIIDVTSTDAGSGVFSFALSIDGAVATSGEPVDLFFNKLGNHQLLSTSTDFMNNVATTSVNFRIVATPESTISDIERAYSLGWFKNRASKESLIAELKLAIRFDKKVETVEEKLNGKKVVKKIETIEEKIDKIIGKLILAELKLYKSGKILNNQTYQILVEDINWLLNN